MKYEELLFRTRTPCAASWSGNLFRTGKCRLVYQIAYVGLGLNCVSSDEE